MRTLRTTAAVCTLLCATACATFRAQPMQPLPVGQVQGSSLAQCAGWQTACASWAMVQVYVSQVLEQQRAQACTLPPLPPAQPASPAVAEPSATPTQQ